MLQIHKLIVVIRKDLEPGYQIAQSGHALAQFMLEHPDRAIQWNNNFLICLSIENEEKLHNLYTKLQKQGIAVSAFCEPDIDHQMTSIAFEGTKVASKLTSSLPLALKGFSNAMLQTEDNSKVMSY